mmetsp:Transcript_143302/g.458221  ORF Transcript_143302/g.458221 Transcript_143302/m.458221 type:complete len:350 (-) Transcript_143302:1722-2771(-)
MHWGNADLDWKPALCARNSSHGAEIPPQLQGDEHGCCHAADPLWELMQHGGPRSLDRPYRQLTQEQQECTHNDTEGKTDPSRTQDQVLRVELGVSAILLQEHPWSRVAALAIHQRRVQGVLAVKQHDSERQAGEPIEPWCDCLVTDARGLQTHEREANVETRALAEVRPTFLRARLTLVPEGVQRARAEGPAEANQRAHDNAAIVLRQPIHGNGDTLALRNAQHEQRHWQPVGHEIVMPRFTDNRQSDRGRPEGRRPKPKFDQQQCGACQVRPEIHAHVPKAIFEEQSTRQSMPPENRPEWPTLHARTRSGAEASEELPRERHQSPLPSQLGPQLVQPLRRTPRRCPRQ